MIIDPDRLARGIDAANVPTLLLVLHQLTGDDKWVEQPYLPSRIRMHTDNDTGGFSPDEQQTIRDEAKRVILEVLRSGKPAPTVPTPAELARLTGISCGEHVPELYGEMFVQDMRWQLEGLDSATETPAESGDEPYVTIIGAGIGGIGLAIALKLQNIPFVILEKNSTVGGTWHDNRYPGAGVDAPSHLYSFAFAPNDWTEYFAHQPEILGYLERVVREHDLLRYIKFGHEVTSAHYDDDAHKWTVTARTNAGEYTRQSRALVSAVGIFNPAITPDFEGLDNFAGQVAHTADWPEDLDLKGRRVVVIGSGASAMQAVPRIAKEASELYVVQRSPHWVGPFTRFGEQIPEDLRYLMNVIPEYRAWYRVRLAWIWNDRLFSTFERDPEWYDVPHAVNSRNNAHRVFFEQYVRDKLHDRPDLVEKCIPTIPPFAKRMLFDNGWFETLKRPNVELITARVDHFESDSIVFDDPDVGTREIDVAVMATGFDVARFLTGFDLVGSAGVRFGDASDDARAFLGTVTPGFPNFFMLYGPNLQPGHGGSYINVSESQIGLVLRVLQAMRARDLVRVEVRPDVHDDYNAKVDAAHENLIWMHQGVTNYYKNATGRVVVNSPFTNVDFWRMAGAAGIDDFVTEAAEASATGIVNRVSADSGRVSR